MPTERPRALLALAGGLTAVAVLAGCAAADADDPARLDVVIADGGPNGDAIAVPGGIEAAVSRAVAALPAIVDRVLAASGVPGMAVAVVFDGETVYADGAGTKAAGEGDPVDAETVFQIASVSKSLTGTIVAAAVSEGIVEWDTPVRDLLPGFALADPYVTQHATIADYLTHRTGLYTGAGDDLEALGFDRATILARLRLLPLDDFRSTYNYSNFGITVAGEAVAAAAGTTWEELAERLLFDPLGMDSTSTRYADFLAEANRARLNALVDGRFEPRFERDPDAQAPAGGVSSNVIDLAEWMKLVLDGGMLDGAPQIASDALLPAISGQQINGVPAALGDRGGAYGYGFNVGTALDARPTLSHSGAFLLGAGTNYRMLPGLGLGIVALTNGAPVGAAEAVVAEFLDLVLVGAPVRDWVPAYRGVFSHYFEPAGDLVGAERPAAAADPAPLVDYVGTYANDYFGELEVAVGAGGLVARLGSGVELSLEPWDGDVFAFDIMSEEAPEGSRSSAEFDVVDGTARAVTLAYFDRFGLGTFTRVR